MKTEIIYKLRPQEYRQPPKHCSATTAHHRWSRARHTTSTSGCWSKDIGNPACSEEVKQCEQLVQTRLTLRGRIAIALPCAVASQAAAGEIVIL